VESRKAYAPNLEDLGDLPAPLSTGKDQLTMFELSLPFARTSLESFLAKLDNA